MDDNLQKQIADAIPEEKLLFKGNGRKAKLKMPPAPPWRSYDEESGKRRGEGYRLEGPEALAINLALYLRRPLLVTGSPGTGKSTIAYAIAYEFELGPVLIWPITSRSTLQQGLYHYDAIGRMQDNTTLAPGEPSRPVAEYLRLGPLGTALAKSEQTQPVVLLIDEFDKSDIDLPNDLLHLFEEGFFEIPELVREARRKKKTRSANADSSKAQQTKVRADDDTEVTVRDGRVRCSSFPIVIITSNDEREFPAAFQRRCLRLDLQKPEKAQLMAIIESRVPSALDKKHTEALEKLVNEFLNRPKTQPLATDQLLNAAHLLASGVGVSDVTRKVVLRTLGER